MACSGCRLNTATTASLRLYVVKLTTPLKRLQGASTDKRLDAERRLAKVNTQINRIVSAIAEGTDTPALRIALLDLEEKKVGIEDGLAGFERPSVVELPQNLGDLYRRKVERLQKVLNAEDATRHEAVSILRSLIDTIILRPGNERGNMMIDVCGQPEGLFLLASGESPNTDNWMIKVVAEEGLEPPTRGL